MPLEPRTKTIAKTSLFAVLALGNIATYQLAPEDHGIALSPRFRVMLSDGCVWLYNEAWPYRGSLIQLDGTPPQPPLLRREAFDLPGVYYRYFEFPTHVTWSFKLSLWYPLALSIVANPGVLRRVRNKIL